MNLSITNECNRRCEYCFQKEWYLAKNKKDVKEMSLDTIEKFFDWMGKATHTSIMGGEALLHSKIMDIFELAKKKEKTITVISNISCETNVLKDILEKYTDDPIKGWLINTDYPKSHKDLFLRNFKLFKNNNFSLSTTLLPDSKKIKESADRINEILNMLDNRENVLVRISPMSPNYLTNYKMYDYTLDIINFIIKLWDEGMCRIGFDCPINACEINPLLSNTFNNYKNYIKFNGIQCRGHGPFDICVDNSVLYCFSCRNIRLDNFMNFKTIEDAEDAMTEEWKSYWRGTSIKCDYKNCEHFNPATCLGVCAAKNEILQRRCD